MAERRADWQLAAIGIIRRQQRYRRGDRRFGDAVPVGQQDAVAESPLPLAHQIRRHPLTADDHQPGAGGQVEGRIGRRPRQLEPEHRRGREDRHAPLGAQGGEPVRRAEHLLGPQHDGRAGQPRRVELFDVHVPADRGELQEAVGARHLVEVPRRENEAEGGAVLDDDALGTAGRARGVEDVCGAVGGRAGVGIVSGGGERHSAGRVALVEDDERRVRAEPRGAGWRRDDRDGLRVRQHEAAALVGIGRIDRDVSGAGLHHAQQRRRQRQPARQANGDARAVAGPGRGECMGQPVGVRVQRRVGQRLAVEPDGGRVRPLGGDLLEAMVDGARR